MGGKFKFQGQDSDLEYIFLRFGDLTNPSHFLKKTPLKTCGVQGNLLKGIDKKTIRRGGIEPIRRVFTHYLFSVTHFL